MYNKRKLCFVTGSRADYGLLYLLLNEIKNSDQFELQIIVTGMHLSPEFGNTYKNIEDDGFKINCKVEMLLSSDSESGICKSIGLGNIGFADAYKDLNPDLLLVLGDRFEILSAVISAMIFKIPIIHLHGGEITEGAFDDSIRHSITKMSHFHFCSTDEYKKRVIQLGEDPNNVYNFGAPGIENIKKLKLYQKEEIEKKLNFKFMNYNLLITFHPITLDKIKSINQFSNLLNALSSYKEVFLIFTYTNADTDGRIINKLIDDFVYNNSHRSVKFSSLGQLNYLSIMQYVDGVLGNSSSGIIEAPSFKIGTIDIGDRQKGRIKSKSVISTNTSTENIKSAIKKLLSKEFKNSLKKLVSPYEGDKFSVNTLNVLKKINVNEVKKKFNDINF